jgi:hypothetical protein
MKTEWIGVDAFNGAREYLKTVAIAVEAAGTVDRAVELGLVGGEETPVMASGIRDVIPPSRGGDSSDPHAEDKWATLLGTALLERGIDTLEETRAMALTLEKQRRNEMLLSQMRISHPRLSNAVQV